MKGEETESQVSSPCLRDRVFHVSHPDKDAMDVTVLRDCPQMLDYLRNGIVWSEGLGWYNYPDGTPVPRVQGKTMVETMQYPKHQQPIMSWP